VGEDSKRQYPQQKPCQLTIPQELSARNHIGGYGVSKNRGFSWWSGMGCATARILPIITLFSSKIFLGR